MRASSDSLVKFGEYNSFVKGPFIENEFNPKSKHNVENLVTKDD